MCLKIFYATLKTTAAPTAPTDKLHTKLTVKEMAVHELKDEEGYADCDCTCV